MPKKKLPENKKVVELERKLKEETDAKLRLAAELANVQKRAEAERGNLMKHATAGLLEKLVPVLNNFYRASTHAPEVSLEDLPNLTEEDFKKIFNYFSGIRMIERQMEEALSEAGLKRIQTSGVTFDHNLHEAISYEESDLPADIIIGEIESGWMIDESVIQPAKVRVSKGQRQVS
ncbi:MAG: nucleotide exchange factor GrpE [Candidatus Berkelbacteria bacterium]|nr:nucleotide exchange factor GrpE [Candidatus Berkelbacteria bacterium]